MLLPACKHLLDLFSLIWFWKGKETKVTLAVFSHRKNSKYSAILSYIENSIWQWVLWLLARACECRNKSANTQHALKSEQPCVLLHERVWDGEQQLDGGKSTSLSRSYIREKECIGHFGSSFNSFMSTLAWHTWASMSVGLEWPSSPPCSSEPSGSF